ncbi:MAG: S-layer homology domain-containing protein [Defluviitaleaceae bacterium]|nr:S-layer homology domain-containing protein [Defluviitaleaceae bacterium]
MKFFCIAVSLFFLLFAAPVFAAETGVLSVSNILAEPGETVTVSVTMQQNPGIANLQIAVEYDASRLSLNRPGAVTRGTALTGFMFGGLTGYTYRHNPFHVAWAGTNNNISAGTIINVEFFVLENAPAGNAAVTVTVTGSYNIGETAVGFLVTNGGVTVLGDYEPDNLPGENEPDDNLPGENEPEESEPEDAEEPTETTPLPSPAPPINIIENPARVYPARLPPIIREAAGDNPVFAVSEEEAGVVRERVILVAPHVRGHDILQETIVAFSFCANGETRLVIPSFYDENLSAVRLLGHTDEFYMIGVNSVEFTDVSGWYTSAVTFVAAREIFSGVGDNLFDPQSTMTRAMFVTALAHSDGIDLSLFDYSPFVDTDINRWYGSSVAWAAFEGILCEGILDEAGIFNPASLITREEMALIFANYLEARGFPLLGAEVPLFYDIYLASPRAAYAIQTMRRYSIIAGVGGNMYNPQAFATRAEAAQIFTNLVMAMVDANQKFKNNGTP